MFDLRVEQVLEEAKALYEDSRPLFGPVRRGRPKAAAKS
jgi:hypothetical protein